MRASPLRIALVCTLVVLLVAVPAAMGASTSSTRAAAAEVNIYVVRMFEQPVVAYGGGLEGLPATKPGNGQKINPNSAHVRRYVAHLDARHADAAGRVGAEKLYDYRYTFNGFAARLTGAQAAQLEKQPDVLSVEEDERLKVDTSYTPTLLGLDAPNGLWAQLGGQGSAGENVVIGIVDTGVWPEHPSFSDRTGTGPKGQPGKLAYRQLPGWHGKCTPGEDFNASHCNHKLIAAQYYVTGFGPENVAEWDFLSPRDWNGHGSHVASTAGGNAGVDPTGLASAFDAISGMAPRARIAAYKVCWEEPVGDGGCNTSDSVAAIDQAVADGVDVINFSISGTTTNFLSPVEVAFLFAADAGVFVSTSSGNAGNFFTTAHPSPWVTTVGATTHDRTGTGEVVLGNGASYTGAAVTPGVGPAPLVWAGDAALAGADPAEAAFCFPGADSSTGANTLDPAKVAGKIVVCDRGGNVLVNKSAAVKEAGGVGVVIANIAGGATTVFALLHAVPTVHVDQAAGDAIRAYIALSPSSATAEIMDSTIFLTGAPPVTASFSSRGPSLATEDQLKPDVTAPGVDILAAVAPPGNSDALFSLYQGTSMSSPHVAGLGALLIQAHPDWSPMMVKSALMTSAGDVAGQMSTLLRILEQGAGLVAPNRAVDPGLVFDHGFNDWLGFLCGTGQLQASYCPALGIDPSDLNLASIGIAQLAGVQTLTRTVTNVSSSASSYSFSTSGLAGLDVSVSPSSFTIAPGASQELEITFRRTTATLGARASGHVTWTDGTHTVRVPVIITPVALSAPVEVTGTGTSGSVEFSITGGYDGPLTADPQGLVAAQTFEDTVLDDPANSFSPTGEGITTHEVTIPAGTTYARFSLFDDHTDGNDDLDLYVYNAAGTLVGASGSPTSEEEVNLTAPPAGTYTVYVHGWQTDGPDAQYTLFTWAVPSADEGNMTVTAPATVETGVSAQVTVDWTGLNSGEKYLGRIAFGNGTNAVGATLVAIDG